MNPAARVRRLAAIMFSDVVGYTAKMAASERAGLRARERHRRLVRPLVERHGGEAVEARADEFLSLFPSALEAVRCALAIQAELESDLDLELHVGIHLGDVLLDGEEISGDGVNIAARICALSEGGGIRVSEEVYQAVRNQPDIEARALGKKPLKNVGRPVRVFAIGAPGALRRPWSARRVALWALGSTACLVALAALGFALQRPLLRLAMPYLLRATEPAYEQEIAFATTTDGVRIAYAAVGEGPTVLIVPGWFTHLEHGLLSPSFEPFTPRLGHRHRVVRYDGRGFGLSDRGVSDLSLEGRVRDLEAVVAELRLERFALFGTSAGGPPAVVYANRHPERVTRLALYGSFARLESEARAQWEALAAVVRAGWGRDRAAIRQMFTLLLTPEADEVMMQAMNEFQHISADAEDAAFFVAEVGRIDVTDDARGIRVPTLVMHVEGDQAIPFEAGRELAGLIPAARFMALPGVNHMAMPEDEALAVELAALEEWLDRDLR